MNGVGHYRLKIVVFILYLKIHSMYFEAQAAGEAWGAGPHVAPGLYLLPPCPGFGLCILVSVPFFLPETTSEGFELSASSSERLT